MLFRSVEPDFYENAIAHLDTVRDIFQNHALLKLHSLYNVNIPSNPKDIRITRQGGPNYSDDFAPIGNDLYRPVGKPIWVDSGDDTLDTDALHHGYITITPLTFDRTDWTIYRKIAENT